MNEDRMNALGFGVNAWALGRVAEQLGLPRWVGLLATAYGLTWQASDDPAKRSAGTLLTLPGTVAVSMTQQTPEV